MRILINPYLWALGAAIVVISAHTGASYMDVVQVLFDELKEVLL